jgi:hypothetical protein
VNETNQDAQADTDFTKLLDYALCCAIRPGGDNPVMNPPDINDATHRLPNVEKEKGRLLRKLGSIGLNLSRKLLDRPYRCQKADQTTSNHVWGRFSCTIVCCATQRLVKLDRQMQEEVELTPIQT